MNNITVIYHYIRDNSNFKAFTTEQFRNQLQLLKNDGYRFITIKELITTKPTDKTCCLTFDDGIKDGISNALPILQEFNATATFFIPMKIFVINELMNVQKRHLLSSKLGEDGFIKKFNKFVGEEYDINQNNYKYVLDHMDGNTCEFVLSKIFNKYFNEKEEFDKIYLNQMDVDNLLSCEMEIGTHGFNHYYLGERYYNDMKNEIQLSYGICKILFELPTSISYPFGSYTSLVEKVAKSVGYKAGVTTIKKYNIESNLNPFALNRYDCIDIGNLK